MFNNDKKYPLEALVDINSEISDKILHHRTDLLKTAVSTYSNSSTTRPREGDKITYKSKEYFVTWVYYIDGRTILDFYKDNNVYMGIHISQVKFISRYLQDQ